MKKSNAGNFRVLAGLFAIFSLFLIQSCSKDNQAGPKKPVVYAAGAMDDGKANRLAAYWKDGVVTKLTDGTHDATVEAMAVVGNDVYMVGEEDNANGISVAKLWKNGTATVLTDGIKSAYAWAIYVSDAVYVAGSSNNDNAGTQQATYWKISNGVVTTTYLTDGVSPQYAFANGIATLNGDVYVSGAYFTTAAPPFHTQGVLWKNDSNGKQLLGGGPDSRCSSITVSGTDVYVAGYETILNNQTVQPVASFWKNGVVTHLTDGTTECEGSSILVSGSEVYVGGYADDYNNPVYWKKSENSAAVAVTLTDGQQSQDFRSIWVNGSDVYTIVKGNGSNHGGNALLKNGTAVAPFTGTDGKLFPTCVVVQ